MTTPPRKSFDVVVAATAGAFGIGKGGTLPWRLKADMALFKRLTSMPSLVPGKVNAVVMGRKTYESIPLKFRPLPGRRNVVLSRNPDVRMSLSLPAEVAVCTSLDAAVENLSADSAIDQIFVIGGGAIYEEAVRSPACARVILTCVHSSEFDEGMDTFFPKLEAIGSNYTLAACSKVVEESGTPFAFAVYEHCQTDPLPAPAGVAKLGESSGGACGGGACEAATPPSPSASPSPLASATLAPHPTPAASAAAATAAAAAVAAATAAAAAATVPLSPDDLLDSLFRGPSKPTGHPSSERRPVTTPLFACPSRAASLMSSMEQHPEMQYLNLIRQIMDKGVVRGDRTGTGTMRFSLRSDEFPLLTTKRVFWRGVAEELLWFVKGSTNAKLLQDKDIHIWDGNGSAAFLASRGLGHREEGDLGPVYGFQWRHFGAAYGDMHGDYTGKGVDQLAEAIKTIKANPSDRRILLTAWNPSDLDQMALPPCHMFCQFYVANGELSCQMYQRSADMGLGVPFNIASYALLTRLVAQCCGLTAGDFVHTIGDAHVYLNHTDALRQQLSRAPRPFPKLTIKDREGSGPVTDIDGFEFGDFEVTGYKPHGAIKMQMAV